MKYLDEYIVDRINSKRDRLESMLLDKVSLRKILRDILIEFVYTSNAIEGSTLSIEETRSILDSGQDMLAKRPYFQHLIINHSNAFEYINRNSKNQVTTDGILELHKITLNNIDKDAGSFRDEGKRDAIRPAIDGFLEKLNNSPSYHVIEKSAILQSYFHQIRPFNYGTGTTCRLVAKWLLNYEGYIFGLPLDSYEMKYYRKCAEKSGQGTIYPLVNMMVKCVEDTLDLMIRRVKSLSIISIEEAMKRNQMNIDQMIDFIKKGSIKAYKKNGLIYVVNHDIENISRGAEIFELII